jgi:hypothetical protein
MKRSVSLTAFFALFVAAGCSNHSATRSLSGQLTPGAFTLDNAVVIAHAASGKSFVADVSAVGGFHMLLPTGDSYRLTLADSTRAGVYADVAAIRWPVAGGSTWARVGAGAPILLSNIALASVAGASLRPLDDGNGSGGGGSSGGGSGGDDHASGDDGKDGDDEIRQCHGSGGEAELPYDVRPALGSTFKLDDAFLREGPLPAAIVSVTGATWRAAELSSDSAFVITQADCDHMGNRATGRDRVFVTWKNSDGTVRTDHLDIRYCDGGGDDVGGSSSMSDDHGCEDDHVGECGEMSEHEADCHGSGMDHVDRDDAAEHEHDDDGAGACPTTGGTGGAGGTGGGTGGTGGGAGPGAPCTVNADCAAGLSCVASTCGTPIP